MGTGILRSTVCALIVISFGFPPGLAAQEERGADLVVTRLDGSMVEGELIAVRLDSLLLLSGGKDVSVGIAEIHAMTIVRRSPTLLLTVVGFLLGSGIVGIASEPLDEWGWANAGLAGIAGAVAGLVSGVVAGGDKGYAVAGEPEAVLKLRLDGLRRISREALEAGAGRRPRFRLGLGTAMGSFDDRWESQISDLPWQFVEDVPPGEAGPHVGTLYLNGVAEKLGSLGPVSLGYEWTERWISEVELSIWNRSRQVNMVPSPSFVSTADGRTYTASDLYQTQERYDCLLVGLAYRPVVPLPGRKASVEIGVAAGPAWVKIGALGSLLPADNKTAFAARVQAAYDHSFTRSFSLGVYSGYRHLEGSFPESTVTSEMTFTTWPDPVEPIIRQVEMTVPARDFSRSGFIYGLRLNFRI